MPLEDYLNRTHLSQGSWAEVYRASHIEHGRVILKIRSNEAINWKEYDLFEREITVMSSLNHPQIPVILEHGEENGQRYFVMSDVGENTLYAYANNRPVTEEEVIRIGLSLTSPLGYIHGLPTPIIHRDINPFNIVMNGQAYLIDFGVLYEAIEKTRGNTTRGYGTIGYTAFEVFEGNAKKASDIFSLGRVLIYLLTGKDPQESIASRGKLKNSFTASAGLKELIDGMTEPFIEDRIQTIEEVKVRLELISGKKTIVTSQSISKKDEPVYCQYHYFMARNPDGREYAFHGFIDAVADELRKTIDKPLTVSTLTLRDIPPEHQRFFSRFLGSNILEIIDYETGERIVHCYTTRDGIVFHPSALSTYKSLETVLSKIFPTESIQLHFYQQPTIKDKPERSFTLGGPIQLGDSQIDLIRPLGVLSYGGNRKRDTEFIGIGLQAADNVEKYQMTLCGMTIQTVKTAHDQTIVIGTGVQIADHISNEQFEFLGGVQIAKEVKKQVSGLMSVQVARKVKDQELIMGLVAQVAEQADTQLQIFGAGIQIAADVITQSQVVGMGLRYARQARDQITAIGPSINVAQDVQQQGGIGALINAAKSAKAQMGLVNYSYHSNTQQIGLVNLRRRTAETESGRLGGLRRLSWNGDHWWNPNVSLFYNPRKKEIIKPKKE